MANMAYRTIKLVPTVLLLMLFSLGNIHAQGGFTIKGKVVSKRDKEALSFAAVSLEPWGIGMMADIDGNFTFSNVQQGECNILTSSLGYYPTRVKLNVSKSIHILIEMDEQSFKLEEVSVMGKQRKGGETVKIDQAALEYIQPTSLHDVLLLLPGSVVSSSSFSGFKQISVRQAGSDINSSLGVGVVADGVAISNDGMRSQLIGITPNSSGRTDREFSDRNPINSGADLRMISTDHIESVEVSKGISSAKFGDLSSGMIQINSKKGESPLRVRAKTDLKNKLAYIGKGLKLPKNAGSINFGLDYLHTVDDIREAMDQFSRITGQIYYTNVLNTDLGSLQLDARINQTISANKMKTDELTHKYFEEYRADYNKTGLMIKGALTNKDYFVSKLDLLVSTDFVSDQISRSKLVVSTSGALSAPLSTEPGENIGQYLPGMYYSTFGIDNKPINFYTQLNAQTKKYLSEKILMSFDYGLDLKIIKNVGDGVVLEDPSKPPYPFDNSYIRPRRNIDIPALVNGAAYLQSDWTYHHEQDILKLSLGARLTKMFNLPADYSLSKGVIADPRINASYVMKQGETNISHTFRAGFGIESKLPTLDYLYPDKVYRDFYMLNAYNDNPDYRNLIVYTHVFDVENKQLDVNQNKKFEIGYDLTIGDFSLALTGFVENSESGFDYYNYHVPLNYDLFMNFKGDPVTDRKPVKDDYIREDYSTFTKNSIVNNNNIVRKKGLEYRIVLPRIKAISSQIELNGAYYSTKYSTTLPMQYSPDRLIAHKPYPYVGIYDNYPENKLDRFNTNVWINTHIPKFGLMVTNFFQCVWFNTEQYNDSRSIYPYMLLGTDGKYRDVTPEELHKMQNQDPIYRYLKRSISSVDYALSSEPVTLMWNIKATKEFNRHVKLSFFVNNIIDINPKYKAQDQTVDRSWTNPYFGLELFLNF